jgi:hypothetical protein
MANVSSISGFRYHSHQLTGARPQVRKYFFPATDGTAVYVGDAVKLAGAADTDGTAPTVTLAAAGDAICGIVVGLMPDPTNLNVDGQRRAASTARYAFVMDDPNAVFEVETSNGTPAAADIGLNINHAVGTPNATTATSGATVDMATKATTATLTFKLLGASSRVNNDITLASAKVLVKINNHQFSAGTGTLGA